MLLPYEGPYDWDPVIAFFAKRAIPGLEHVDSRVYKRITPQGVVTVAFQPNGFEVTGPDEALPRIRRMFDLDADLTRINRHLRSDPFLAPLVAARPGLRVPGSFDPFELGVRAILGQQVSVDAARILGGQLLVRYGVPTASAIPELTHTFPTAEILAAHDGVDLGMPKARARAITNLARAAALDPQLFTSADSVTRLQAIPGVGPWTVQYIALRGMRYPDAFPAADIGLMRAMADNGVRPTAKQLEQRAEPWRPYRGYAAQHLWTLDAVTESHARR